MVSLAGSGPLYRHKTLLCGALVLFALNLLVALLGFHTATLTIPHSLGEEDTTIRLKAFTFMVLLSAGATTQMMICAHVAFVMGRALWEGAERSVFVVVN